MFKIGICNELFEGNDRCSVPHGGNLAAKPLHAPEKIRPGNAMERVGMISDQRIEQERQVALPGRFSRLDRSW